MSIRPEVTFVIATYNRKDILLENLRRIGAVGGGEKAATRTQIIVVDNGSTDGTVETLRRLAGVTLIQTDRNYGSCAKAIGADQAEGDILIFLDDDAYPRPGLIERVRAHFDADDALGAASFLVHLPDGNQECSALPGVFTGCGVAFRTAAYRLVGGLDRTFFMQAEEYDLSFRLLSAGWKVETFSDLHVDHLKTAAARHTVRTTYYDICNNLRVIARYLPAPHRNIYRADWTQRYGWLAEREGHTAAFWRGVIAGRMRAALDRSTCRGQQLSATVTDNIFAWTFVRRRFERLAEQGVRRVILCDLGKNVYAFHRAARETGIDAVAIADDLFAAPGRTYRGTPIITVSAALNTSADAFVVSNTSWVHAERRYRELVNRSSRPVFNWFSGPDATTTPTQPGFIAERQSPRTSVEPTPATTTHTTATRAIPLSEEDVGAWAE